MVTIIRNGCHVVIFTVGGSAHDMIKLRANSIHTAASQSQEMILSLNKVRVPSD